MAIYFLFKIFFSFFIFDFSKTALTIFYVLDFIIHFRHKSYLILTFLKMYYKI